MTDHPAPWRTLNVPTHTDARGSLSVAEAPTLPFPVRRVYWLHNLRDGADRGSHVTFGSEQVFVPVHGGFDITLDNGASTERLRLDHPGQALWLGPGVWRELSEFTDDATVLIMSSTEYADTEYCRDYDAFLERVRSSTTAATHTPE